MNVCETKVRHESEFEANRAAAIAEHKWGEEMESYQCGNHWHITHTDLNQRRGTGHFYKRCPHCKSIFNLKQYQKHHCPVKEARI
jgi:hypothetical protein